MEIKNTTIFGLRAIIEAIESGSSINKVYLQKRLAEEYNTSRRNIVAFSKGFNTITEYYEDLSKKRGYEADFHF